MSGWINNEKVVQGLEKNYNKKMCHELHHKSFEESILQYITVCRLMIHKKLGIKKYSSILGKNWIQF